MRTCSCEACSCLELCLETVPWTLLGNRFWEPYLQAVPKNLALLGNLFLDTCLGASFWKLAWERFSPSVRKLGVCSHPKNKISNQIFQEQVRKQGYQENSQARLPSSQARVLGTDFQARFARPGSQARFARTGSQARVPRTVQQGYQARSLGTGSQARLPRTGPQARFASKLLKNRFPSKGSKKRFPRTGSGSKNKFSRKVPSNRLPARFPRTRSQAWFHVAHVPRNSFPRTTCKAKFRRTSASKVGSKNRIPSKVPKDSFLNKVPKQRYEKQVPEQGPNEQV